MTESTRSLYEPVGLRAVRPYLIVDDANAAIAFYTNAFDATEVERHTKSDGGVGHAKLQIGDTLLEIGEHPSAQGRDAEPVPRVGLRLYVTDIDDSYARAVGAGATGDPPSNRLPGTRSATVRDAFGLTVVARDADRVTGGTCRSREPLGMERRYVNVSWWNP